jgi:hypothetical protein
MREMVVGFSPFSPFSRVSKTAIFPHLILKELLVFMIFLL